MQTSLSIALTMAWSLVITASADRPTCETGNYIPSGAGGMPPVPAINMNCREIGHACRCVTNTMAERLQYEATLDTNNNGTIEGNELAANLEGADDNNDGCVSPDESAKHHTQTFGDSENILRFVAIAQGNENCIGYPLEEIRQHMPPTPVDVYIGQFINFIISYCEADHNRYHANCDCAQLPDACMNSRFSRLEECRRYREEHLVGRHGCVFNPHLPGGQEGSVIRMVPYSLMVAMLLLSYLFINRSMK